MRVSPMQVLQIPQQAFLEHGAVGNDAFGDGELPPPPPSRTRLMASVSVAHELPSDDAGLVRAVWAGDVRAHVVIWRRYMPMVRSRLGRSLGGQDLEDQTQEVFLRLFEYVSELRDPAALRSFIIGITLRVAGTERRRRRCRGWLQLTTTGEVPDVQTTDDDGDAREVATRLLAILGKLSPESARVFRLRYIEGHELADVAAAMGISLATVKRHLARISARVRAMARREPALAEHVRQGVASAHHHPLSAAAANAASA